MVSISKENNYILILCGGTGPRLWPLSRSSNPKQFLSLFGRESLLEQTIIRSVKSVPASHVYIISNRKFTDKIKIISSKYIPEENLIFEPDKKNTAMAILYGTYVISRNNPNAVIATLPSDHLIKNLKTFKNSLETCFHQAASTGSLVTIGIKPDHPSPSYGYIMPKNKKNDYFVVNSFVEKPDSSSASELIKNGAYWNSGIYIFTAETIINEFKIHENRYYKIYQSMVAKKDINKAYSMSQELPIDRAISEKSHNIIMVPARFDWSDVGEWRAVYLNTGKDKQNHARLNQDTDYVQVNSSKCLISADKNKLVGLVGVDNLAIIDTPDCLLVCNLEDSYNVRDLVAKIVKNKKQKKYFLTQND